MKNKETITLEIKNYIETKLRKNRGEILSIEIKTVGDYIPNPQVYSPDFIVGGFVEFSEGDKIFVYRFENEVNNYENGRGYGTYSKSFNKVSKVKKVIEGWDKWAYTVGTLEAILDWEVN